MQQARQMTCGAQPGSRILVENCEVVRGNLLARYKTVARCKRSPTESIRPAIREELKPAARTIDAVISPSDAAQALQAVQSTVAQDAVEQLQRVKERGLQLWSAYETQLAEQPVKTKALTSMVGLAVGDLIAQASTGAFDPMRTVRMAAFGAALHGPVGHFWYRFLDAKVMPKNPTAPEAIVGKMVLDQAIFAPIFTALFYAVLTTMEGRPEAISQVLSDRLIPTVFAGYALWPLAHLVSFKFVPNEYRLLYINAVNLIWTVHLSKLASAPIAIDSPLPVTPDPTTFAYPTIPVSSSGGDVIFVTPGATTVNTI